MLLSTSSKIVADFAQPASPPSRRIRCVDRLRDSFGRILAALNIPLLPARSAILFHYAHTIPLHRLTVQALRPRRCLVQRAVTASGGLCRASKKTNRLACGALISQQRTKANPTLCSFCSTQLSLEETDKEIVSCSHCPWANGHTYNALCLIFEPRSQIFHKNSSIGQATHSAPNYNHPKPSPSTTTTGPQSPHPPHTTFTNQSQPRQHKQQLPTWSAQTTP